MLDQPKLKFFSQEDLAQLGAGEVAYVRRIETQGCITYAAHAGDGTFLCEFADRHSASAALFENDLEVATVH
jgi:hypothetical protein